MTAVDVDALDKLREAATPGPWQVMNGDTIATGAEPTGPGSFTWSGHIVLRMDDWRDHDDQEQNDVPVEDDAALIVAAVNALPGLLAEVRRGRALRERLEGLAEQWAEMARDHDEQSASNTALVYAAHARHLRAVLAAVDAS